MSDMYAENTVDAKAQVVKSIKEEGDAVGKKVLFVGNSITRHGVKEDIGWFTEWGMAASDISKDYVHLVAAGLKKAWGDVRFATVNVSEWERNYWNPDYYEKYRDAREYDADVVVIRFGENVWSAKNEFQHYDLTDAIDSFIPFFCPRGAENKVIMTDCFWAKDAIDVPLRSVAEKRGYPIVHLGDLGARDDCKALGLFWHHGVSIHPGDLGMQMIADRILSEILLQTNGDK